MWGGAEGMSIYRPGSLFENDILTLQAQKPQIILGLLNRLTQQSSLFSIM